MSELIKRELICSQSICYDIECDFCPFADADEVCKLRERVYALPTVNAIEAVRCIDCKHHEDEEPGMVYCPHIIGGWVTNDFFCAAGERKNDD